MHHAPAQGCILSGESIPGRLLLSRAYFRFDSNAKFNTHNYIYKLSKKATTFPTNQVSLVCFNSNDITIRSA
jgi:hypothetical protein